MSASHCTDCGQQLQRNPRRLGTRCKPCSARAVATSQEHREAVSRAMSRRWANPSEAFRLGRAISAAIGPDERARRRERGKIGCNARAAAAGSEARAKAGRSLSRTRLGWLPIEYRAEYFHLRSNHKYSAHDARQIIEGQMKRDLDRYVATGRLQRCEVMA